VGLRLTDFNAFLQPPSAEHWFGTTQIGQDVYAQTLRGLQKSLAIGLLVAIFSTGIATIVGACAGYFGGWVDRALMWMVDLLLVLPGFLLCGSEGTCIVSVAWRGRNASVSCSLAAVVPLAARSLSARVLSTLWHNYGDVILPTLTGLVTFMVVSERRQPCPDPARTSSS
jgi:ABC-type dipeptide/oligopeptide/nickel transport system permease subunit